MALTKHPYIYKAIKNAMESFGEKHHITARQHFAPLLGFTGPNGHIQVGSYLNYTSYNPVAPHPFSVDHLAVLLDELGDDRKIILDAIAREFDMVVIPKQKAKADVVDINLLVDVANMENSDVFRVTKEALQDKKITINEVHNILKEIEEAQKANAQLKDMMQQLAAQEEK